MKNFYRLIFVVTVVALTTSGIHAQNVGIGTATPAQKLEIAGSSNTIRINGIATGGTFIAAPAASTDKILFSTASGDIKAITPGVAGAILTISATGIPTWSTTATSASAWQLTGNSGTTVGTNFIGTTDAVDFVLKTSGAERMRIGATGLVGVNIAPVASQQLTVGSSTIGNTAMVGTNTATYNVSTSGIVGTAGIVTGGGITNTVTVSGPAQSINAGLFGSAGRGNGTTTLGFGTVGLLGNSMPNSSAFPPGGAGVLGATKTGGMAPFAAGVAGFASGGGYAFYGSSTGGGYGMYNTATGGGIGYYTSVTGSSSLISGTSGNFGVYVLGNKNTVSGMYSYMGSKGVATVPTVVSAVYATTDSTSGNVWAMVANNTKSTTAPTGNGLLVYGTTNEIGTVTLGQNGTTYMTGGTVANGALQFDNSTNTNTVTINTGVTSANYALTLPTSQGAVSTVLTNDGSGNLSWSTPAGSGVTSVTANLPVMLTGSSSAPVVNLIGGAGTLLYGTGTASAFTSAGTTGQVLLSGGTGVPTWGSANSALTTNSIVNGGGSSVVVIGNGANQIVGATNATIDVQGTSGGILYGTGSGSSALFNTGGTTGNILLSAGASAPTWLTNGSNGQVLTVTAGVPTWVTPASSGAAWQLTGNAGTVAGTDFIGTTDAVDFVTKTGGTERMRVSSTGYVGVNAAPITGQQLTVATTGTGSTTPAGIVGSNTLAVTAGSANGAAGIVGLANGGLTTFKDSVTLNMSVGVYGSSGAGSYVRNTGSGFVGIGVLGLVGGSSTTFPNSQPLPSAAGVVGASNNGGVGVVGMTSKGGTGVFATTASTNGQASPLPVSGYGVFAVGSSKSEGAVYGFIGNGEDQFPLTTNPAVNASIYGTTNLTGANGTTLLNNWAMAAINNNSITAPTGNGLLVYGTTNEIGTVTLGQNGATYMTGGTTANGALQFDNSANTNTVTINTGVTSASYTLTLPTAQATTSGQVLTNDGTGNLSWSTAGGGSLLTNGIGISTLSYNGISPATVSIANTAVTPGTYGDGTDVAQFTVNAQGQLTFAGIVPITGGVLVGTAGGDLTGSYPNPTIAKLQGIGIVASTPSAGQVLTYDGTNWVPSNTSGTGTVTSVGLSLPSGVFNVTGSPVTSAGTLTGAFANQTANTVFAGPASGGAGAPTFRTLVAADLPAASGNYIQNQNSAAQTANFYITGNASIGTIPVTTQQLTVGTSTLGNSAVVGNNTAVVAAGSGTGAAGVVGLGNGGAITYQDSSALYMDIGVYGSSGNGSYARSTGVGYIGVGMLGLVGATIPNSQPLPAGVGVVGASNIATGGVGVMGMTSKGGTGVYATTASTNGQVSPLPVSGYGVFAVGSSKSEGAIYGFIGNGTDPFPLTTTPAVNAAVYATTNLTGSNPTTGLKSWTMAAINNNTTSPTNNGLLVYGTTNAVGALTLGQNTTTYMTGGTAANGSLVFDNSTNTNAVTINTGVTSANYSLTLPTSQGAASTVLTNDGAGNLSWTTVSGGSGTVTSVSTNSPLSITGTSAAPVVNLNGTSGGVLYGTGAASAFTGAGTTGQILISGGTGVPTWASANSALTTSNLTNGGGSSVVVVANGNNQVVGASNATVDVQGTSGGILYGTGSGTSSQFTGAGTTGQVLLSNGTGVPTWGTPSTSATAWQLTGNAGTSATTNFIGTTDAIDFVTRTNNTERMRVSSTGFVGINAAPVSTQQLTVNTATLGNSTIVGNNTAVVAGGSTSGAGAVVGLANGGILTYKDSSALNMSVGVYGSSGAGSYVRNTGVGFVGVGVLGLVGGASTTFPNSQPLPAAAGVVGASNNGGVGVVGMTSKGGTGVYATTASTNGQVSPLPVSGYGVFAVGSSKSEGAVYGFIGSGESQFPLTTNPAVNASLYGTTNLTGANVTTLLNNWAVAAINNNSLTAPTGNGLLVYGTTNEIGTVTLGQNSTTYMTGGTTSNGQLVFDNSANTNTVTLNAGLTSSSYALTLPTAQGGAGQVLTNDGSGNLSWSAAGGGSTLSNGTGINTLSYNGSSPATVSIANTTVTPSTYGDATHVPQFTVNAQGQLTFAGNILISGSTLTGTASGDLSGTYPGPITVTGLQGIGVSATAPTAGQILTFDGTNWVPGNTSGTGTVTSVGLALPASVFNVTGSPVTSAGILIGAFANQTANTVFAGPASGGAGAPTFRTLVAADLPAASGNYIQNQNSVAQTANFYITGNASIGTAPVTGQQFTVATSGTGSTTPAAVVGSNSLAVAAGSTNGAAGIVGLANGGLTTFKDSVTLNMSVGVYGSSGAGSYVRNTGSGFVGVGVLGLVGGSSTTFPNSQPLPSAAGVVGASNNGGVGVVGMTSKGGTGVFATTASTNGQASPLPVSGYGVFAVGSSKSEGAVYGFIGNGEDQFPLTTNPAVNASIYGTTNLTGANGTTLLNNWAMAAINNNSITTPAGNGLLVYGTTNAVGTVTLGQNTTTYMAGGTEANGTLVFDNSTNTNTVTLNTGITSANYNLTLPAAQATAAGQVLANDGAGNLSWAAPSTITSVSATAPLSVTNPTTIPGILLSGTNGGILYGMGAGVGSAFSSVGTAGQLLQSNGASAPTWTNVSSVIADAWNINGNSGTTAGTNFIGTTDAQDLVFKTHGAEDMRIDNTTGNVGIGTGALPAQKLTVIQTADANKYVVSSSAIQTSLATDYQNVAVYGYAKGGNNNFGYGVGVMGIVHPTSHGGIGLYGGIATSAPTLGTPNTFYGVYTDVGGVGGSNTGYAAAFMNGNVGIGTATPAQALDIAGNVSFSQALMPNGIAGTAGQVLQSNGNGTAPTWVNAATGTLTSVATGTGLTGGTITTSGTISIANTSVTVGSYGDATHAGTFTVNAQGQLTAAASVAITPAWSSITGTPTTLAGYGVTDAISSTLANDNILIGNPSNVATAQTVSGDVTISNTGVTAIGINKVTYGQMQQVSTGTLLGNLTGATANVSEITLGSGLSFSGTTLIATGTGGTVTSIGLSVPGSSIFGVTSSPVTGSGTLNLTTTGISGGIPYFNSSSTLSSSGVLAQNAIVLGGGAGSAPTALTTANNAVLTTNSSGVPSWSTSGVLNNIQVITTTSAAPTKYTPTPGTNIAVVELIGGGGGGGTTTNPGTNVSAGAGGGAGGYIKFILSNPLSSGYTIAIGAGGVSASGGNSTTFQLNGTVTYTANGGSAGNTGNANFSVAGGAGGTTTISGGGTALLSISGNPGGNGNSSNTTGGTSGSGGSSILGGSGGSVSLSAAGGPTTGGAATANSGSGGAGGITGGSHGVASGGAGGTGVIIITEYK